MTDSQLRSTWNQISTAASTVAAPSYASPLPQPSQNTAYMKNVHQWSTTSSPAPMSSSSRPQRSRTTRAGTGTNTPTPGTPVPLSVAPTYMQQQPIYSQPPPPTILPPSSYVAPISNPPKAPLPTRPQALESTYASRMKTGTSLLVQPIFSTPTANLLGGMTRSSRRGAVINYADPGSGDDMPDAGELDSEDDDEEFGGRSRQAPATEVSNAAPQPPALDQLDKSYLGLTPPERFIKSRYMPPTPHMYPQADAMFLQAQKRASLVPIRVEFETETLRVRDCFVWNVNEGLVNPEAFARVFCNDLELPANPWVETIAAQIRAQIEEWQDVAGMEIGMDGAVDDAEEECRVIISIDVQIANHHLMDQIEWDLLSPLTPEEFSRTLCAELGLTGEAVPLIAHAVHEELVKHKKDVIEWGVLAGAAVESTPAPDAPRDRSGYGLLKDKTGLGLGLGRAPRDGRGPKTLRSVWRDWADAEEFGTSFEVLTAEEVERREVERERASRRLRRETSKFQSSVTGRMRNLRYR